MTKKAEGGLGISLTGILEIILTIIILIALWNFIVNWGSLFTSDSEKASQRNFDRLVGTIKGMTDGEEFKSYPIYLDGDLVIVGYPSGKSTISGECDYDSNYKLVLAKENAKPLKCIDEGDVDAGCICLCEKDGDIEDYCQEEDSILKCASIKDFGLDVSFSGGNFIGGSCDYAIIVGRDQSEHVYLKRTNIDDNQARVNLCLWECD